ncbi:MAG: 5-deoxy-glucuronate isomerase [Caldilinea sp.]|nr:5-deoxy-glucuronate isomerase [Caldilinea sp.]MCB0056057.1 5-deoxy-glucuronate isomerase [Caldilineaceae bacterium]MCB0068665.1 5-deoxy-glucuronate isomerase [Caldilineaceae bacterium]MCB0147467.1 5-deoxy-glucuronate isomerase [Caldilineaceae bacterium]MCB9116891.1 5-deoxy-glucuronate isomerase [Caldilineaceae bacterium]
MEHLIRPAGGNGETIVVTPQSAGWQYLSFRVVVLAAGERTTIQTGGEEVAIVPLQGAGTLAVDGNTYALSRSGVFVGPPALLYAPPGKSIEVVAESSFEFAMGGAPAEGKYGVRLIRPEEIKCEIRGGGAARRQVNHILAPPLPAERLILFEVYVPGGSWSGWPPHCHDGSGGSPYLEETYYYRIDPADGFAIHRNYRLDNDFDELLPVRNGELVLVTQGYHPVAAAPGCNVYFLNYLAGELLDEERARPPLDDYRYAWIKADWEGNRLELPIARDDL